VRKKKEGGERGRGKGRLWGEGEGRSGKGEEGKRCSYRPKITEEPLESPAGD
jgi:hypothetical protein